MHCLWCLGIFEKEITALLLCQGVAITVMLFRIHESCVYVHSTTDLRYQVIKIGQYASPFNIVI